MANTATTIQPSSRTPGADMDINTTGLAALQTPLSTEESNRFSIVYLSGPIKIIVPFSAREEMETNRDQCDVPFDSLASSTVGANAINQNNTTVQSIRPIDISPPAKEVSGNYLDSVTDTPVTNLPPPAIEKNSSEIKQPDCNHPDETQSPFCPYIPGNEIILKTPDEDSPIKAVIVKTFPTTLSCCMVIRFVEPAIFNNTSECVLKLYDRRFSNQLRSDWEAAPWTPELEKEYQEFVACGDAGEFFSYWDAEKERDFEWSAAHVDNRNRWSAAKREAYLQWDTTDAYEIEKRAYESMADLQGNDVPKIFGEVVLNQPAAFQKQEENDTAEADDGEEDSASATSSEADINPHIVNIPGILMQHIDGFVLTDLHEHLPKDYWQSTVDTAIQKLNRIQESGILNRDVNTRSFMVDPLTRKVMMIDFCMVTFREDVQDDIEWERLQAWSNDEEAIGLLMQGLLKQWGGSTITYKPSEQYWRFKYRYRDMGGEREGGTEEEEEYVKKHKDFVFQK